MAWNQRLVGVEYGIEVGGEDEGVSVIGGDAELRTFVIVIIIVIIIVVIVVIIVIIIITIIINHFCGI